MELMMQVLGATVIGGAILTGIHWYSKSAKPESVPEKVKEVKQKLEPNDERKQLCAWEPPKPKTRLTIISYNVNDSPVPITHAEWSFASRFERIKKQILVVVPDIVLIQELLSDAAAEMCKFLHESGFTPYIHKYSNDDGAFMMISAFRKIDHWPIRVISNQTWYYADMSAESPINRHHEMSVEKPEGYFTAEFQAKLTPEEKKKYTEDTFGFDSGRSFGVTHIEIGTERKPLIVVNTHFGIQKLYKEKSAEIFFDVLSTKYDMSMPIYIAGDFNYFADRRETHIDFLASKFDLIRQGVAGDDGDKFGYPQPLDETAMTSFAPYEYDFGYGTDRKATPDELITRIQSSEKLQKREVFGGKLDYMFTKNMKVCDSNIYFQTMHDYRIPVRMMFDPFYKSAVKEMIAEFNRRRIPPFPSDHFPIVSEIEI